MKVDEPKNYFISLKDCEEVAARKHISRPSGFKGEKTDKFLEKGSVYGQKYFCNSCGKTVLGTNFKDDKHHHWSWCKWMKAT